jgi:hypothetical protein
MMVGPLGGTVLEVRNRAAFAHLAEAAYESDTRPRHIIGSEEITSGFWEAYKGYGVMPRWNRREPFSMLGRGELLEDSTACVEAATVADLDEVIENSGEQHREDLQDDPQARDPIGFRERHRRDIFEERWWILRENGRVAFQVHVGPDNDRAVQIGGVMTPPDLRGKGCATRGLAAISALLLERRPGVTLFCDENNSNARGLYRKLGFHELFNYRSWLLDEESSPR